MASVDDLRKRLLKRTKKKVRERLGGKEVGAIKALNLIEDLDSAFNLLAEHTIDWHYFHFPELQRMTPDSETYLRLVAHLGERKNFLQKNVLVHYQNELKAKKISEAAKKSIGAELDKKEIDEIKVLALNTLNLKEERKFLTRYLEQKMNSIAPNFCGLCGPVLGAKFLAKTGSLKKLAMLPSSTIQIMGAEKAIFSHLRHGTKPPKYGFLYSHPLVKKAKPKVKGKVARILAAKLSIAIKEDFFGDKKNFPQLKKELEKKVQQLNE